MTRETLENIKRQVELEESVLADLADSKDFIMTACDKQARKVEILRGVYDRALAAYYQAAYALPAGTEQAAVVDFDHAPADILDARVIG